MWGKWADNRSQKYWRAIDGWLPPSENQNTVNDVLNLRLFTGTPYGSVDIVPYESAYSKYKTIAFLGWNTYEDGLAEKLLAFVKDGGSVFLSYCHLNKTDRPDRSFAYAESALFKDLFGCEFHKLTKSRGRVRIESENGVVFERAQTIVQCTDLRARVIAKDEDDNPILLEYGVGKGKVYFSAIAEYDGDNGVVELMQAVMRRMAQEHAEILCDNNNIAFTQRVLSDGMRELYLLNTSCATDEQAECNLTVKIRGEEKRLKAVLAPCEIVKMRV